MRCPCKPQCREQRPSPGLPRKVVCLCTLQSTAWEYNFQSACIQVLNNILLFGTLTRLGTLPLLRASEKKKVCLITKVLEPRARAWLNDKINLHKSTPYRNQHIPESTQPHVHWVSDFIQSSHPVATFSSCLQSFPVSGSFLMSQLFASGGQSIGASDSASFLLMNIQDWFSLGITGLISLLFKWLSRVFSNIRAQKHQFFGIQPSLWSNSHIHTQPLEKP